ncbi:hypothetical protein X474_05245 [Dethiosulfatarculus sandiegensis]|uniref:Uncharacterized protein n=1 Tax=Dethiosulfatarculus sandiegensis TaxID=1429043 RepID=A0A0D2GKD5_9BACT|nr:hypothetical protein X474_05245 [Dethiosulfatarculus sandiegensis]
MWLFVVNTPCCRAENFKKEIQNNTVFLKILKNYHFYS